MKRAKMEKEAAQHWAGFMGRSLWAAGGTDTWSPKENRPPGGSYANLRASSQPQRVPPLPPSLAWKPRAVCHQGGNKEPHVDLDKGTDQSAHNGQKNLPRCSVESEVPTGLHGILGWVE